MSRAARAAIALYVHLSPSVARGTRATLIGILISTVLAAVKILGGIFGQSYALIADGVESLLDIFGSSIVWGSLRYSARPPDHKHPYGHGKAEPLGAMVIAAALIVASIAIARRERPRDSHAARAAGALHARHPGRRRHHQGNPVPVPAEHRQGHQQPRRRDRRLASSIGRADVARGLHRHLDRAVEGARLRGRGRLRGAVRLRHHLLQRAAPAARGD